MGGPRQRKTQIPIAWDRIQRDGWIEHAAIRDGRANDGSTVCADKLKSLLLKINSYIQYRGDIFPHGSELGDRSECFAGQETLAVKMSVSVKTIQRAMQALQNMSLLVVQLKPRPGSKAPINHCRIVWAELLLLDPDRRRAFIESLAGQRSDQSDMVTDQSDMVTDQSDMVTDQSDMVSPEQSTNKPKNKPPPQSATSRVKRGPIVSRLTAADDDWVVVVDLVLELGVSDIEGALDPAHGQDLTPERVRWFCERFRRFQAHEKPEAHGGYLNRWLTGKSKPPPENKPVVTTPGTYFSSAQKRSNNREALVTRIYAAGREARADRSEIERRVKAALRVFDAKFPEVDAIVSDRTRELGRQLMEVEK